jgi:hypothetical protein
MVEILGALILLELLGTVLLVGLVAGGSYVDHVRATRATRATVPIEERIERPIHPALKLLLAIQGLAVVLGALCWFLGWPPN